MKMELPSAYAGKILSVDLSSGKIDTIETSRYAEKFIGGRGTATALYWDLVPAKAGAMDPENKLIVSVGPLAGMPGGLGGSRWGIYSKSPFPRGRFGRDHFCYGNMGGTFGSELRFAGYDGLVVSGKADRPVSIDIRDGDVSINSAEDLAGRTTVETIDFIKNKSGPRTRVMCIGPAGENMVPIATVFADGDASCSGGMGAVMGSKNLKAVSAAGTNRRLSPGDPEEMKRIEQQVRSADRGNVKVWGMDFMDHSPKSRKYPCFGCMAKCLRVKYTADNGKSGKFMCQSRFFYLNHAMSYYGGDNDMSFLANRLCDEYGIDTWELQTIIEWLLACHDAGIVSEKESGVDPAKVGSFEFIERLVGMISHSRGYGELLSGGALYASKKSGGKAAALYTKTDPYDPRYCTVNTLLFPFETREPIQQIHEAGLLIAQWSSWAKKTENAHVSSEVFKKIAVRFWGSEKAADMTTLEGKARAAKIIQERQIAKECIAVCDWMFPQIDVPSGIDHVGDPTLESRILSAVLGRGYSEADLYRVGERVFNLQRAVLIREGLNSRRDDFLPDEWYERGLENHPADPECVAPGDGGKIVSMVGKKVERRAFLRIRDDYYRLRGWDVPTGLQSLDGLSALGLNGAASELFSLGLAREKSRGVSPARRIYHGFNSIFAKAGRFRKKKKAAYAVTGPSVAGDEMMAILGAERAKYGNEKIRHNFSDWDKTMLYHFTDTGEYYAMTFVNGEAMAPVRLSEGLQGPEISYEMDSRVMKAMSKGELSGKDAYFQRLLKMKSSFSDMMKLQSLGKI
jgi:aldehyde:ferredoxin oxidoreductase